MAGPSVSITGDATQLRSALALAQADVASFGKEVRAAAVDIKKSADVTAEQTVKLDQASAALNAAKNAVAGLSSQLNSANAAARTASAGLESTAAAATHTSGASSAIVRELIVMGSEATRGNFSRMPGSFLVLAEHAGGLLTAIRSMSVGMMGAVGAAAALAGGLALLTIRAMATESALRGVYNAALLQGRGAAAAEAATVEDAAALQKLGVGRETALAVAGAVRKIGDMSATTRAQLVALEPDLLKVMNPEDAAKAGELFSRTFGSTSALKAFVAENHLLTVEQTNAFAAAETAKDAYAAQAIALDALKQRIGGVAVQQKQADDASWRAVQLRMAGITQTTQNLMQSYDKAGVAALTFQTRLKQDSGGMAASPESLRANEIAQEYNQTQRESAKLTSDLKVLQDSLASATSSAQRAELEGAISVNKARQDMLKAPGDAGWASKIAEQAMAADAAVTAADLKGGKTRQQINEDGIRAELAVYSAAAADMTRTEAERTAMTTQANRLRITLMKDEATAGTAAAKKSNAEIVAGYDEQLAEARGNLVALEAIETQKLAFVKSAYGAASTEYKKSESEQLSALREALASQMAEIKSAGTQREGENKAELALAVAQRTMSKSQELAAEIAFNAQVGADEMASLDALIATLNRETTTYAQAMKDRHSLDVEQQIQHLELLKQQEDAEYAAATREQRVWAEAANRMGASMESSVAGMITGRETYLQAEQKIAAEVIQLGVQTLAHALASEAAQTTAALVGATARVAADQAAGDTGMASVVVAALKKILAYAGETFGGVFAFMAPEIGPAAAGPATAASAAVIAAGASLAVGTSYVPQDMTANIHRGEMVIPKYDADLLRGGAAGGHTFNYSPTINGSAPGVAAQVQRNHEDFKGYIANLMRNGQLALPGRPQFG